MSKKINTGLTVKINLFPVSHDIKQVSAERARLWIKGQVKDLEHPTDKPTIFNDAGQLITILGKMNAKKVKELKALHDAENSN
jgi:hypothetical protein